MSSENPQTLDYGIARLLAPNPSPFTCRGTQTYLIGDRTVAVIDPGPDIPRHVGAIVDAIAGRPVAAILCTHTHRDHSPAAPMLAALTGAPIIGCAPLALEDSGQRADAAFDPDYAPDQVLADREAIHFDDRTLTAVATPGHTSNHLCFADDQSGALFTGDHVMAWSTTVVVPPDGDMADYMASLAKLKERGDRIYYPAHGPAVDKPQQLIRAMLGHRVHRERQILNIVATTGPAIIRDIVNQAYPALDSRLRVAAGGSVWAHLLDLERRGLVIRTGEEWCAAA